MTDFASAQVETTAGPVAVQYLGKAGHDVVNFVALPGMGRVGNVDWKPVVARLADLEPMRVCLPDPTSNRKTAASASEFAVVRTLTTFRGLIKYPLREAWLLDLLPKENNGNVLAGHSWGGGAACRLAASHPEAISRLVLVSPDVEYTVAQQTFATPTLLIWNKNDIVNPYFWIRRFKGHPMLTLHTTTRGGAAGHMVLTEHADVIAQWLRTPVNTSSGAFNG